MSGDRFSILPERSCADCTAYIPADRLIRMRDGREICPSCELKARKDAAERAQLSFFGQEELFK